MRLLYGNRRLAPAVCVQYFQHTTALAAPQAAAPRPYSAGRWNDSVATAAKQCYLFNSPSAVTSPAAPATVGLTSAWQRYRLREQRNTPLRSRVSACVQRQQSSSGCFVHFAPKQSSGVWSAAVRPAVYGCDGNSARTVSCCARETQRRYSSTSTTIGGSDVCETSEYKMSATTGKPKFQRLPTNVVPEHYRLTLKPNLTALTFEGNTAVELKVSRFGWESPGGTSYRRWHTVSSPPPVPMAGHFSSHANTCVCLLLVSSKHVRRREGKNVLRDRRE